MNKKQFIIFLLFASWLVSNLHRALNNMPVKQIHPALMDASYEVSKHWYVHFILKDISYIFIFYSIWIYINSSLKRDKDIIFSFLAIFISQCADLIHYLLWARHNELFLCVQGLFMIGSAIAVRYNKSSKLLSWIGY